MLFQIIRTDSSNPNFIKMVKLLDAYLAQKDGEEHSFYAQYNGITSIKYAVIVYLNDEPVGCGAIKEQSTKAMEIKRMYVIPRERGKSIATQILSTLELWASELGYEKCVLETGKRQPEAIALYQKNGYKITPNYGQYIGIENSVCFEKKLD
mgnify:CR=1 FL=1